MSLQNGQVHYDNSDYIRHFSTTQNETVHILLFKAISTPVDFNPYFFGVALLDIWQVCKVARCWCQAILACCAYVTCPVDITGKKLRNPDCRITRSPRGLPLTPVWISNHMPSKVWDEIPYPFANFNGCTVEVWEWISNFIPHFVMNVITMLGLKLIHISKMRPRCPFYKYVLTSISAWINN